jgi:ATP-dependent DNA ligase
VFLYAFDLLELNGEDYRAQPLKKRKSRLAKLLTTADQGCGSTSTSTAMGT